LGCITQHSDGAVTRGTVKGKPVFEAPRRNLGYNEYQKTSFSVPAKCLS